MSARRRAVIVGGSLGGLFAANLLRSIDWDVDVFESVGRELGTRGAGIATHHELMAVTKRLGIAIDETIGVHVNKKISINRTGEIDHELLVDRIFSSWGRFFRPLKSLFPEANYHSGIAAIGVEVDAGGATVFLSDGSRARGDLVVGADGFRSTIRNQLMPSVQPRYAGYVAWRGKVAENDLPAHLHRQLFANQVFGLPEGEMMIASPIPGNEDDVRPGHRHYNFVWYHPVAEETELRAMCTDSTGRCFGTSIPPPLIRSEVLAHIKNVAHDVLAPQIASAFELSPQPFFQAIFDLECLSMVEGRIVLLGDAAFVARPHVGMGVAKGALDAECLVDEIEASRGDLDGALARYDASRSVFGRRAVARGRWLGAHLEAQSKPLAGRAESNMRQDPVEVLREVGKQISDIPDLAEVAFGPATARRLATAGADRPS